MSEPSLPCIQFSRAESLPDSLAIFDREASLLVVNIEKPNDYSGEFVDSGRVCFSLDSEMMIEDFELKFSTSDAAISDDLVLPECVDARVSFVRDCGSLALEEDIRTNNAMNLVHIKYKDEEEDNLLHLRVASGIVLDVTLENQMVGIWISGIVIR